MKRVQTFPCWHKQWKEKYPIGKLIFCSVILLCKLFPAASANANIESLNLILICPRGLWGRCKQWKRRESEVKSHAACPQGLGLEPITYCVLSKSLQLHAAEAVQTSKPFHAYRWARAIVQYHMQHVFGDNLRKILYNFNEHQGKSLSMLYLINIC